jgi:hypothetical protein
LLQHCELGTAALTGAEKTMPGPVDRGGSSDYDNLPYLSLPIAFTNQLTLPLLLACMV